MHKQEEPPSANSIESIGPPQMQRANTRKGAAFRLVEPFAMQAVLLAAGFFSGALLARDLGPIGRGEYQIVALIYTGAAPVLGFGIGSALSSSKTRNSASSTFYALTLLVGWILLLPVIALAPLADSTKIALYLFSWAVLLSPLTEAYFYRRIRPRTVQLLRVIDVLSTSLAVTVLSVLDSLTVATATLALTASTAALRSLVAVRIAVARQSRDDRPTSRRFRIPELLRTSIARYWPWNVVVAVTVNADMIAAAFLLGPGELGLYAVAAGIGRMILAPFSAVSPHLTAYANAGASYLKMLKQWVGPISVMLLFVILIFWAFASPLIDLVYGSSYGPAGVVAVVLCVAFFVQGHVAALEAYQVGGGRSGIVSVWPRLCGSGAMVALLTALTSLNGVITPLHLAAATVASACLTLVVNLLTFQGKRR